MPSTTLVTRVSKSTLDALSITTTYTAFSDIPTSSSSIKANSTITETLIHTVVTTLMPTSTTLPPASSPIDTSSSQSTSSQSGFISSTPRRFPTALVAILLSAFCLSILLVLLLYLYRRGHLTSFPSLTASNKNHYIWSSHGLVRASSLEKLHVQKGDPPNTPEDTPIAAAIRKEEQDRLRQQNRSGLSTFYAPQVRHLVQLMGSKEEIRVDVRRKMSRKGTGRSWKWGRGKGMGDSEQTPSMPSAPSGS